MRCPASSMPRRWCADFGISSRRVPCSSPTWAWPTVSGEATLTTRPRARPAAAHKRLRAPGTRAQLLDKGRACAADPPWACRGCTLLNRPERTRCEACGADCAGPAGSASAACGGDAGAAAAHVASAAAQLAAGGRDADAAMAARLQREEDARGRAGGPPGWRRWGGMGGGGRGEMLLSWESTCILSCLS